MTRPFENENDDGCASDAARAIAGVRVLTLGCRLNTYESEVIKRNAEAEGLTDAIVVNTCAVTGEAVRQARQTIRRLRRDYPETRIIATGCAAQIEPETFAEMPEVDHVVGNAEKLEPQTFADIALEATARVQVNDIMAVTETASHMVSGFGSRARAYVQVQNGCDHRCTFCIIPFGRGPSRSVPAGDVVREIQGLVDSGYSEVVLTGVDVTSYGGDLPGSPKLGWLIRQILKHVPDLPRLRLSSIDQVEIDDDLLRALADDDRLMPHLHLSMQAGDDMILKRMKRRHLRDDAIRFCDEARRLRPDVVFGADLIAGFPTETDDMFQNTLAAVDACGLTYLHVFPFSPRQGTPAARMPQLPRALVKQRAAILREKGAAACDAFLRHQIGSTRSALVEQGNRARTEQFAEVILDQERPVGEIVPVQITGLANGRLVGEIARTNPDQRTGDGGFVRNRHDTPRQTSEQTA
ncbi:MAG: tRNA (N(6)-L-threonylcarbamoyladenosine(37)-C(2))-methylthiotransferase MtaB [Pseudomonadota bacterium]